MKETRHAGRSGVWAAAAAMAVCALLAAYLGLSALSTLEWQGVYWQDSRQFQTLCQSWNDRVATSVADSIALESDTISYVERQQLEGAMAEFEADADASQTNYRFRLLDRSGEELSSNLGDGESLLTAVDHIGYASFVPGAYAAEGLDSYVYYAQYYGWTQQTNQEASTREDVARNGEDADGQYILEYGVAAEPQIDDSFYQLRQEITRAQGQFAFRVGVGAALLLAALASLVCLLCLSAGEGCVPTWQEKVYLEVYLLGAGTVDVLLTAAAGVACQAAAAGEIWSERAEMQWQADLVITGGAAVFAGAVLCTALLLRTLAVRLHTGTLGRTSLLCRGWSAVYRGVGELVRQLPLTWRTIAGFFVYLLANVLSAAMGYGGGLLVILVNGAALVLLCRWTTSFARLRRGSRAIAAGDLNYRVDTARMPADLRAYAEDLNNISIGLAGAVDEKMKSERFKAELITNVSHDLKTPLTSIINYVNLLKTTQQTDPKAAEYIEVLDRKSQRLKKLTEDLVEASKASTGVLSVSREKIGMSQLLDQALGEWTEKLEERKLTVVTTVPEGETWVYADGRHLWRVIDNLLSNCAKYAMEGTRIYVELSRGKGQVTLSVKNVSREALNVPAERLMERFVRGEESRSTEGSGLGLSIARSLTELQGGEFRLTVDGDLFKAEVTLPQAN